jgi:plastocyanin
VIAAALPLVAAAVTAVGVGEREYRITPYRTIVPPGLVRFEVRNLGEDVHNLEVRAPDGTPLQTSDDLRPGQHLTLPVALREPGVYRLVCTRGDHLQRGMITRIAVRARGRR